MNIAKIINRIGIGALLLALLNAPARSSEQEDACTKLIPKQLGAQIHRSYPDFRIVRASDYSEESLAYPKAHGISCPGIASADVDGNGLRDTALFITAKNGHTLLVVARQFKTPKWRIATISDFGKEGVSNSYVGPIPAGGYTDLFESDVAPGDYVPEPDRVMQYRSRYAGFMAGTMESTGVAYFFASKRWVHLWQSD